MRFTLPCLASLMAIGLATSASAQFDCARVLPDAGEEPVVGDNNSAQLTPGMTQNFQCWYRDPQGFFGFNTSNALTIYLVP